MKAIIGFELGNAGTIHDRAIYLFAQGKWISHVSQFSIGISILVKLLTMT